MPTPPKRPKTPKQPPASDPGYTHTHATPTIAANTPADPAPHADARWTYREFRNAHKFLLIENDPFATTPITGGSIPVAIRFGPYNTTEICTEYGDWQPLGSTYQLMRRKDSKKRDRQIRKDRT